MYGDRKIPIGKAMDHPNDDEAEVQGHLMQQEPRDHIVPGDDQATPRDDGPEVEGHGMVVDPAEGIGGADELPTTSPFDPDIEGHIR